MHGLGSRSLPTGWCSWKFGKAGHQVLLLDGRAVPRQNNHLPWNQEDEELIRLDRSECKTGSMLWLLRLLPVLASRFFRSRRDLLLENLALRQQLAVLKRKRPQPRL